MYIRSDAISDIVDTLKGAPLPRHPAFCDLEPRLPYACADPTRLRQLLIILADKRHQVHAGKRRGLRARSRP